MNLRVRRVTGESLSAMVAMFCLVRFSLQVSGREKGSFAQRNKGRFGGRGFGGLVDFLHWSHAGFFGGGPKFRPGLCRVA